jgi:hypothetical protein
LIGSDRNHLIGIVGVAARLLNNISRRFHSREDQFYELKVVGRVAGHRRRHSTALRMAEHEE